jgi:glycosyltransferase involved in cell wall biosynthesis
LMQSCDVFVLPSIVEGRALVQQEAMACGLPLIATRNAGADDLIEEGATGFLVPIRSPEAIAEKINWCAVNRALMSGMGIAARERAGELTWRAYGETIASALRALTGE